MATSHRRSKSSKRKVDPVVEETPVLPKKSKHSSNGKPISSEKASSNKVVVNDKSDDKADEVWSTQELSTLITNIRVLLPKDDILRFNTGAQKLSWEKVQFGKRTPKHCHDKWNEVTTKLRRFRTLSELVTDAEEWVKRPWSSNLSKKIKPHPDMPKKPLTPYFRYFLEKRQKYAKLHPEMSMTDLAKIIAPKFNGMSLKKKAKYQDSYVKECAEYKIKLETFKLAHPEYFIIQNKEKKTDAVDKPQTPFQLFRSNKLAKLNDIDVETKAAVLEKIKKHWNNLSDGKRIKWIRKALLDDARYVTEVEEFVSTHPDYKPPNIKSTLTKAERELKDKFDGKPDRPPNSGYGLYSRIMLKELTEFPSKDKMSEISRRWKSLSEKEKGTYNVQASELNDSYKQQFDIYLSNLPEAEKAKVLEQPTRKKKVNKRVTSVSKDNVKEETTPEYFYQKEKLPEYESSCPSSSKAELIARITTEFKSLPAKEKDKYLKMSLEKKPSRSKKSRKLFKNEPKKPPQNAYSLFSSEMLRHLTTIEPRKRMSEIAKRWKALSETEQRVYKECVTELNKTYKKEYSKFISNMSPEDMVNFQSLDSNDKSIKVEEKPKDESSSSSSSSDSSNDSSSSSDESDSSDNDNDKDSSSNDSSSDDSESGSNDDSSSQLESSGSSDGSNSDSNEKTPKKKK